MGSICSNWRVAARPAERRIRYAKNGALNVAYQVLGDGPIDLILSPGWVTHLDLAWDIPPWPVSLSAWLPSPG